MITASEARQRLVKIATSEVGTREEGGNNKGKRVGEYQAATWLKPAAWPWCAAFVCWVILKWLQDAQVRELLGLALKDVEAWRPKTAGAFDFENWAKSKKLLVLGENEPVLPGDLIIFDFSHIGFVEAPAGKTVKTLKTIEGNTNGKGERDSVSGDGVWQKFRARSLAKVYIRLIKE